MKEILNRVYAQSKEQFLNVISLRLKEKTPTIIITANPEIVVQAKNDSHLEKILLSNSSLITADGIGIEKAVKYVLNKKTERITGVDIVTDLLSLASEEHLKLLVYGSKQETLDQFDNVLTKEYSGINDFILMNGYTNSKDLVLDRIKTFNPDIILVALGVPNQELFCFDAVNEFKVGIYIGCGGSIDVLSGMKKRAPQVVQRLNIEWLYRIIKEPKRFKRFFSNQFMFIFDVLGEITRKNR